MTEKWCGGRLGVALSCFEVEDASCRATRSPRMVTINAASFSKGGIDIMGVFRGVMFEEINRPATMLPRASRFKGLVSAGSFSLIGEKELNRGWPRETK